ncbi:dentin sialophosphoprotein [Colias croceus]|uniref:dentin sialophosphoprotein n=1 Tax=Colias crocea TaxID=72248 RepID=UPI001E27E3FC|nr:dentin sialophosphoprotein [Colias croceus]
MASNGDIEPEDNELNESNGDKVVTMMDVLQEQEDFEEDANAVLGASDDKNCTYPLGYIKRQAIYACLTCCSEAKEDPTKRAGVCLACSLSCHENHELIELYTKRNFRCDCGNPKFNSNPCQFTSEKTDLNEENSYNQNFSGLYCVCHRPYPDPEATEEDEMIQCIICEDWLHAAHLEATVPTAQYAEMICKECMGRNEFLHDYTGLALNTENDFIDVMNTSDDKIELCNGTANNETIDTTVSEVDKTNIDAEASEINESKIDVDPPKESDSEVNEGTENNVKMPQIESEVPMDTNNEEPSTENISIEAKDDEKVDTEKKDNVPTESPKVENSTDNTENKNSSVENIDSHINALKEIVDSSEDSVANKSIDKENESKDCNSNPTDSSKAKMDENDQSKDTIPEAETVKNEESKLDENPITDNKVEEITESNDSEDISKTNIPETENVSTISEIPDKPTPSENENDEKLDSKIEEENKKPIDDDSTASSKDNIKDDENTETPINDATNQDTTTLESNQAKLEEEKKESSATAEELEKMEEDRLLADPDEKVQEEKTDESKASEDSVNTEGSMEKEKNEESLAENIDKPLEDNKQEEDKTKETVTPAESAPMDTTADDTKLSISAETEGQTSENEKNGTTEDDKTKTEINSIECESNKEDEKLSTEVNSINETNPENTVTNDTSMKEENDEKENSTDTVPVETSSEKPDIKRKLSTEETEDAETKKRKVDAIQCNRPNVSRRYEGATFWPSQFRQKLCTCNECLSMYKDLSVLFLIDPEDTVTAYENLGKEKTNGKPASQYEKGLQALSSLDRIQQINVLTEYNIMRDKFLDFLKSFKERRKIVTEEDVKAFFAGMKPKRRPDGVYFCR